MKKILFISLLVLFNAEFVLAEIYKWVDEKGAVHFTDDPVQVPEKYRSGAERIDVPEEKAEATAEPTGVSRKKEDAYRDQLGRGEEYWRGRVEEWRKKLKALQEKLEGLRTKYNDLVEKFNDSKSTAERGILRRERDQVKSEMDQCRVQLDEAKSMLDKKIPEDAEASKARSDWVK